MKNREQYLDKNVKDINIKEFLDVIKKRFWIIAVVTIIASLAGYFYSSMNSKPLYQTSTRIIIGSDSDYMNTLIVMIKDPLIMDRVKSDLKLSRSSEAIASQVETVRIDESQVIMISVTDKDPKLAVEVANATAKAFKSEVGNILDFDDVQLLSEAKENSYPINENQNRTIIIATVFGFITGFGFVFLLDSLDDKVNKDQEIEEILGVPVLGIISNMNKKKYVVKQSRPKEVEIRGDAVGID